MRQRYKNRIILIITVLSLLAIAFFWGGNQGATDEINAPRPSAAVTGSEDVVKNPAARTDMVPVSQKEDDVSAAGETDKVQSSVSPEIPKPVEPEDVKVDSTAFPCTLSVKCTTILDNLDRFDDSKLQVLPPDGIIYPAAPVTFYQGESVFNVLQREMKKAGIHLEFTSVPVYNSTYIEGIGNIYELDCGELSGWVYKVNGLVPNYGCSLYQLQKGDVIELVYTCNLGRDVGGYNFREE